MKLSGKVWALLFVAVAAGAALAYYLLPRQIVVGEKFDPTLTTGNLATQGVPGT